MVFLLLVNDSFRVSHPERNAVIQGPVQCHVGGCSKTMPNKNCQGCQALDVEIAMSTAQQFQFPWKCQSRII